MPVRHWLMENGTFQRWTEQISEGVNCDCLTSQRACRTGRLCCLAFVNTKSTWGVGITSCCCAFNSWSLWPTVVKKQKEQQVFSLKKYSYISVCSCLSSLILRSLHTSPFGLLQTSFTKTCKVLKLAFGITIFFEYYLLIKEIILLPSLAGLLTLTL